MKLARQHCKPVFAMLRHPHRAIERCLQWSKDANVPHRFALPRGYLGPCDGVVFVHGTIVGYRSTMRLWKLKHTPTVDFLVRHAFGDVFELMLRSPTGDVQSLHRFTDGTTEYILTKVFPRIQWRTSFCPYSFDHPQTPLCGTTLSWNWDCVCVATQTPTLPW